MNNKVASSWPAGTPEEVGQMADRLWGIVRSDKDPNVGGTALILTMTRMIVTMGGHNTAESIEGIMKDLGDVTKKWNAAYDRRN